MTRKNGKAHTDRPAASKSNGAVFSQIPLADLKIDDRYQRELNDAFITKMVAEYNPDLMAPLDIVRRPNGDLFVVDGQHRRAAAERMGVRVLYCRVHTCKSLEDEAQLFLELNGNRKAVQTFDKFQARCVAKEPVAVEIENIVHSEGLRFSKYKANRAVMAVQCLEHVHRSYENLGRVLRILTTWQDGDSSAYDGVFVKSLGAFLHAYPKAKDGHAITGLRAITPLELKRKVHRSYVEFAGTRQEAGVRTLRALYNAHNKGRASLARRRSDGE